MGTDGRCGHRGIVCVDSWTGPDAVDVPTPCRVGVATTPHAPDSLVAVDTGRKRAVRRIDVETVTVDGNSLLRVQEDIRANVVVDKQRMVDIQADREHGQEVQKTDKDGALAVDMHLDSNKRMASVRVVLENYHEEVDMHSKQVDSHTKTVEVDPDGVEIQ